MSDRPAVDSASSTNKLRKVELYTDGACSGNPGPGGWAFILRDVKTGRELTGSGGASQTTNNQMEMQAVIEGLQSLTKRCNVTLYSDSSYVLQGLQQWLAGWKAKGWKRKQNGRMQPVKNIDLWQELDRQAGRHQMNYVHVRGHTGHPENERCDAMAVAACQQFQ